MSRFFRISSLFTLVISLLSVMDSKAQRVQYMQLFYYGPQATTGSPIMRFSPAFKGKTSVHLTEQDEFMKRMDPMANIFGLKGDTTTSIAEVTTEKGTYINGKLQTEAQLKKRSEKESAETKAWLKDYVKMVDKHVDNVTTELSKALNGVADDGWEVVQMTSLDKSGIVYLLRKAK